MDAGGARRGRQVGAVGFLLHLARFARALRGDWPQVRKADGWFFTDVDMYFITILKLATHLFKLVNDFHTIPSKFYHDITHMKTLSMI